MNKFQLLFGSFKVTILHDNCKLSSDKNDQKAKKNAMVQRERTKSEALPNLGVFEARPANSQKTFYHHHRFQGGACAQNVSCMFQGVFEGRPENVSLHFEGF